MDKELIKDIKFNEEGMVPCIVQDCRTGEVLMMAWMNKESLEISLDTGFCTYYSRSRKALWKKGETSGNVQKIVDMAYDCDGDTLLVLVEQTGSACHTGERSCFHNPSPVFVKHNILYEDYDVIADIEATLAISSRPLTFWLFSLMLSTATSTAFAIPLFRIIGFAPAAMFFIPSLIIA
jgi:phosphoribosyl-AMP cyclohydrolase